MRASSLSYNTVAVNREIDSIYDAILDVRENLVSIATVAGLDVNALVAEIQDAKDFTGITVVAGSVANWDSVNKILTVPTLKGDQGTQGLKGDAGLTVVGPQGIDGQKGDRGIQGLTGATGATGGDGPQGIQGLKGDTGSDLTVEQIGYNGNGTFTWHFSDETMYTTPNMIGPQGLQGSKGDKGDTGISVHHTKGTSTTDSQGDFSTQGQDDTYTFYGDADETIVLGYYTVHNGSDVRLEPDYLKASYESNLDTNAYTDAEKLKLAGIIDDTTTSTLTAYSSSKVQEMHNAQAATMAALGTAQGEIANTNTPVFASIPKYPLVGVLDFTTVVGSTNTSMFELYATNNVFAFKQAASYTFLSEVVIKSNVSAARVLTFRLVDNDTDAVLMTQSKNMIVASGNTENFSISTLLVVDVAPKNVRVEVSCSDTGYEFRSFNSILASSVGVGSESVDSIDTALGALVTEVLV